MSRPKLTQLRPGETVLPGLEDVGPTSIARTSEGRELIVRRRQGDRYVVYPDGRRYFKEHHVEVIARIPVKYLVPKGSRQKGWKEFLPWDAKDQWIPVSDELF